MVDLSNSITKSAIFLSIVGLILSEIYCVSMAFVVLFILRRNFAKFSKQTYRLHFQFTLCLTFQIALPLFLIVLPVSYYLVFIIMLGGQSKRIITQLSFTCLTIYGAINSLMTIIFVGSYRRYTYNKFIGPLWIRFNTFFSTSSAVTVIQNVPGHPINRSNSGVSVIVTRGGL
jgi:hypothetical protein